MRNFYATSTNRCTTTASSNADSDSHAYLRTAAVNDDEFTPCAWCGFKGCDVRVLPCGCSFHARCLPLLTVPMKSCPNCDKAVTNLSLCPMSFHEIDEARKTAQALANNSKRNRKRKSSDLMSNGAVASHQQQYLTENSSLARSSHIDNRNSSGLGGSDGKRTGRWTKEEMDHVDELISKFESGSLPLVSGTKLNDFLANMLNSKQSRLTKKMKNAKLSARAFTRILGYISDQKEAIRFSECEDSFFHSIQCHLERAEIKFHIRKEWREMFSTYCVKVGQNLDAEDWLESVEELDRRDAVAKDEMRMVKRKLIMGRHTSGSSLGLGFGQNHDSLYGSTYSSEHSTLKHLKSAAQRRQEQLDDEDLVFSTSSPFLSKVHQFIKENKVPFEQIDAWVPSLVPVSNNNDNKSSDNEGQAGSTSVCKLCYAGSVTSRSWFSGNDETLLTNDQYQNLKAFAKYSETFSFAVGCGLPGRVYQSGVSTWEENVQNAPLHHFQRCGGAKKWGIRTVVGIAVPSPSVGRIILSMYSLFDRPRDHGLIVSLAEELTRLSPSPKWKLIIELSEDSESQQQEGSGSDNIQQANQNEPQVSTNNNACNFDQQNNNHNNMNNTEMDHSYGATASNNRNYSNTNSNPARNDRLDNSINGNHNGETPENNVAVPVENEDPLRNDKGKNQVLNDIVSLLGEHIPSDPNSPLSVYVPGFMAIRLMMLKSSWSDHEKELIRTLVDSYSSYTNAGREANEIAVLLARDCMFLVQLQQREQKKQQQQQQSSMPQQQTLQQMMGGGVSTDVSGGFNVNSHNNYGVPGLGVVNGFGNFGLNGSNGLGGVMAPSSSSAATASFNVSSSNQNFFSSQSSNNTNNILSGVLGLGGPPTTSQGQGQPSSSSNNANA